jgi:hypothetical protein
MSGIDFLDVDPAGSGLGGKRYRSLGRTTPGGEVGI